MTAPRLWTAVFCAACALGGAALAQPAAPAAPAAPDTAADPGAIAMAQLYDPAAKVRTTGNSAYLVLSTTGNRTQAVVVSGTVTGTASAPVRIISSTVAMLPATVDPALAVRLLTENNNVLPYGYWALATNPDGTHRLSYQVELRADAPADAVQKVMGTVATRADALEAELTGKDVY